MSLTAAAAWAWDHMPSERSANELGRIRRGLEADRDQQQMDRLFPRNPC